MMEDFGILLTVDKMLKSVHFRLVFDSEHIVIDSVVGNLEGVVVIEVAVQSVHNLLFHR